MIALRRDVSLLLEKGHSQARLYPIIMLWNEAEICRERRRADLAMLSIVMQHTIVASDSQLDRKGLKQAATNLKTLLKELQDGRYG